MMGPETAADVLNAIETSEAGGLLLSTQQLMLLTVEPERPRREGHSGAHAKQRTVCKQKRNLSSCKIVGVKYRV